MMFKIIFSCLFINSFVWADSAPQANTISTQKMNEISWDHLTKNLETTPIAGTVIASPSKGDPDYFRHWVRDAGLVVREIIKKYSYFSTRNKIEAQKLSQFINNWIQIEKNNQMTASKSWANLGEPLFEVTGEIYAKEWSRPQMDGPAIRAIAMMEWVQVLKKENKKFEIEKLYKAELPAATPIKIDLEYVAHHWRESNFDLWEEVKGQNFFTLMAQRMAMFKGAQLAQDLNDLGAAHYYRQQYFEITAELNKHYDQNQKFVLSILNQTGGWSHKKSNIDVSVVLASNYFSMNDGFMTPDSTEIKNSSQKIIQTFEKFYDLNKQKNILMIGRYPEDIYDGVGFAGGNPWYIATNGIAEQHCRSGKVGFGQKMLTDMIQFAEGVGHMSEQIHRVTGQNVGAKDLTWSYSSYLRAYQACFLK